MDVALLFVIYKKINQAIYVTGMYAPKQMKIIRFYYMPPHLLLWSFPSSVFLLGHMMLLRYIILKMYLMLLQNASKTQFTFINITTIKK